MVVVGFFIDGIDKKARQDTVFGKLGKHMITQKICFHNDTDHNIIFSKSLDRMRAVGVDQKNLVFHKSNRFPVDYLRTLTRVDIVDFDIRMDMFWDRVEARIFFDGDFWQCCMDTWGVKRCRMWSAERICVCNV